LKYGLHGLALSIITTGAIIGRAFIFAFLMVLGSFIGLMVGLFLIVLLIGFVNTWVTERVWDMDPQRDRKTLSLHGLFLTVVPFLVSIPSILAYFFFPSLMTGVALFTFYFPVNGYVTNGIGAGYGAPEEDDEDAWELP
jgi:hypothetical protein